MAGVVIGISGNLVAAILYDAAKGIYRKFNDPLSKALEDTSVYFLKKKNVEFRIDKFLAILKGDVSEIEKLKSGESLIDGDEFALQFVALGDLHFEDQSEILPIAKEIVDYFIERFEFYLLTDPKTDSVVLREYIKRYSQLSHLEHSQIISNQQMMLDRFEITKAELTKSISIMKQGLFAQIDKRLSFIRPDDSATAPVSEYQEEIDYSRKLLQEHNPRSALKYLMDLRERIWYRTEDALVRFRILTNIGSAQLELNENTEAGLCFIEALQYQSEDEKALCNAALGHFLIGNRSKCQELFEIVLNRNPANLQARSLRVETFDSDQSFEDIVENVPEEYRNTTLVAASLGVVAEKLGELYEAQRWFRTSVKADRDDKYRSASRAYLGTVLLKIFLAEYKDKVYLGWAPPSGATADLAEVVELLTQSWNEISHTELRSFYPWVLANRAIAHLLMGQSSEAVKDIDEVLNIEPSDVGFRKIGAVFALGEKDTKKAISLLQDVQWCDEVPDAPYYLALALSQDGRQEAAVELLTDLLERDIPETLRLDTCITLLGIYLDSGEVEKAKCFTRSLCSDDPGNPCYLGMCAKIARCEGEMDNAIELLDKARKNITDATPVPCLQTIANEFCFIERPEDAAHVFSTYVDTTVDSPDLHNYLLCLYRVGDLEHALKICKALREAHGPLDYVTQIEAAVYEDIGDLPMAEAVCREYISRFPQDLGMQLSLAVINCHQRKFDEVDRFLQEVPDIDIEDMTLLMCEQFAFLYLQIGDCIKALDVMYEARRQYFREKEAHGKYLGVFIQRDPSVDELLDVSEVGLDVAVCIAGEGQEPRWILVEDRDNPNLAAGEYPPSHRLAKSLLGKKVGDIVTLSESELSQEQVEIKEIRSKYVYAFQKSLASWQDMFPGDHSIQRVPIGQPEQEGEVPVGFQKILGWHSRRYERESQIEQLYRENKLTIGSFAEALGVNIVQAWSKLMGNPELGIRYALNLPQERDNASSILETRPKLVADPIALLTLHGLRAGDLVVSKYGKLGIAASSKAAIQTAIEDQKVMKSGVYMGSDSDEDGRDVSPDEIKRYREFLEEILNWIDGNCETIPCYAALAVGGERRELGQKIGRSFMDSILIAQEKEKVLFSDDRILRSLAKERYSVNGIWTQALLRKCLDTGSLERDNYNRYIVKLSCSRYYDTAIDGEILLEAARQSAWRPSGQFKVVAESLSGKHSEVRSAVTVAADFIYLLWQKPALPDPLIHGLLDSLVLLRDGREAIVSLVSLKHGISNRFGSRSRHTTHILGIIEAWESIHVV